MTTVGWQDAVIVAVVSLFALDTLWPVFRGWEYLVAVPVIIAVSALWVFAVGRVLHLGGQKAMQLFRGGGDAA